MTKYQSQEFLFRRIKEILTPDMPIVDSIASILHITADSAYRRIRGETPLVLDEARELCNYFKISLDHVLDAQEGSTLFQNVRVNTHNYTYDVYLKGILKQMKDFSSYDHKEIIYRTKDMPLFHNFYFEPLIAFRYFFWMKTIIQHPDFSGKDFTLNCVTREIIDLSQELSRLYNTIPSTEIWNTECINAAISQIEFYKDLGYFSTASDIKQVYESLEETLFHLKSQVENGSKFMPGESQDMKKNNFTFFYNRVMLADNTIMITTDDTKTVILNYDGLNYMSTRDITFCKYCYEDLQNLIKRSTIISESSEKQRHKFFGIMLNKISDRKKNL